MKRTKKSNREVVRFSRDIHIMIFADALSTVDYAQWSCYYLRKQIGHLQCSNSCLAHGCGIDVSNPLVSVE